MDCWDMCANVVGRSKEAAGVAAVALALAVELGRGRRVGAPEWIES